MDLTIRFGNELVNFVKITKMKHLKKMQKIKQTNFSVCALTAIFIMLPSFLTAQDKLPIKLGLKVAPNMCWMNTSTKGYSYDGLNAGVTVGFISDIYFAERYAFSTGFNFDIYGGKLQYADSLMIPGGKVNGIMSRKYNLFYLEIPLTIKMQTKEFGRFSFYGQIGFGTAFRMTATSRDEFITENGEMTTEKNDIRDETTLIRESVIIGIGTEYHLDQDTRLIFGISYSNSLNNILTGSNSKTGFNQRAWLNYAELCIGILF